MIMEYSIVDLEYFLLILILIPKEALSSHKKSVCSLFCGDPSSCVSPSSLTGGSSGSMTHL